MTNLAHLLDDTAQLHPDRPAVVAEDRVVSYRELLRAAETVTATLRQRGVQPGDRVLLVCPNTPEFTAAYFGILKCGAIVVPLNVSLRPREIAYHMRDCQAAAVVVHHGDDSPEGAASARSAFEAVESCAIWLDLADIDADPPRKPTTDPREDDDTAVILYTSGTTVQPKGAELRHRNLRDNALVTRELYGIDPAHPDTYLCVLPLFHSFGQSCLQNSAIAFGGTLVLMRKFDAQRVIDLLASAQVTIFAGVPTMYWAMLGATGDLTQLESIRHHLRIACSGGAALPVEVHRRFRKVFGVTILEGYGLSETSPSVSFNVLGRPPRVGSIGVPIPGVQMKLIDPDGNELTGDDGISAVGEIAVRGHNVMKGYYRRPEATQKALSDGWFLTGDLARRDADGYYYIVDRAKDLIIRGGYNVYPREIEEVLLTHPAVSLAAVVGIPHESLGEEIKAYLVPRPGHDISVDDLARWARDQFAAYKCPRVFEVVDQLPMTSTGKVLKRQLAQKTPTENHD
ncbi:long-chain fatty acid--CoA ligase [Aeromicrobium phragmitis]|uniref:Long-chain fatty acid--CoA ligase n=1 Tax=Aeromicrobium phragmitis TaxID=2478914 RepID=A0A3L8PK30_9ACTN|nr:long-chain fatty acid--CoA ligase [Aeromicrobium phragmitis]RLV55661.1 long-chain fatty acid--CoA ligase [Aeromicrobium phragmitis]